MKLKLLLITFLFFSEKLMAQFTVVQPEFFRLANNSNTPCPISDIGKIYYHIPTTLVLYCVSSFATKTAMSYWEGGSDIYYMGKVGISKGSPSYELDMLGIAKSNTLSVNGNLGINTTTPNEKLELVNRSVVIKSTADTKSWVLAYSDVSDRFEIQELGFGGRMYVKYDGNMSIGNIPNTDKLRVEGDVSYAGSLSVAGKGTLTNTNATQLQMHMITTVPTSANYYIDNNTCSTISFGLGNNNFSQAPVVILGQKNAGFFSEEKLVVSVDNVTTTLGSIRLCNNSGGIIYLHEVSFSLIAIGQ